MTTVFKIPLYSGIHKGQRRWLADLSIGAGRTDFSKQEEVDFLIQEMKAFTEHLKEHADLEERFIHPTLGGIVASCPRGIEAEHRTQHLDLEDLIKSLEMIKQMPKDHENLPKIGHEFYLALNRFVSTYLKHIDFEEDHVQQILFNDCTPEELLNIFKNILAAQPPPVLMANLKLMVSGLNLPETIGLFTMAKSLMPASTFQQMISYVSSSIEPQKWAMIQAQLGKN
jgi:hemerythrin-like domain-containing protein